MKRLCLSAALGALTLITVVGAPSAQPKTFYFDQAHSEIGFNIRHFFTRVHGQFPGFSGTINYDLKDLASSSVEVVIRDTSIFTGNERRDNDLRGQDFFWTEKYPTITFKSTKVIPGDSTHYQVVGDFTLRDVTKPVTLDVEQLGMGPITMKGRDLGTQAGFFAKTTIDRKDFGIVWNRTVDQGGVMLADDVEIVLNVAATTNPPRPPAPAPSATKK